MAWNEVSRVEFRLVLLHVALALAISPIAAVLCGLAFSAALFILKYAQISGVGDPKDLSMLRSNVVRHPHETARICRRGAAAVIFHTT